MKAIRWLQKYIFEFQFVFNITTSFAFVYQIIVCKEVHAHYSTVAKM